MLTDALKFLQDAALKNQVPTVEKANPHTTIVKQAGKDLEVRLSLPRTPHRNIRKLSDLALLINYRVQAGKAKPDECEGCQKVIARASETEVVLMDNSSPYKTASEGPVVYVNAVQIDYVETPDDARGLRVRMPLTKTPPLRYLEKNDWMDQDDFVRMLWIDFRGCFATDMLIKSVENVNFNATMNSAVGKQGDRASVSKEIKAEAVGASKVPEEVAVRLDLFDEIDNQVEVLCAVEIDPTNKRFRLTPFPRELIQGYHETYGAVASRLAPIQTYHGEYEATL